MVPVRKEVLTKQKREKDEAVQKKDHGILILHVKVKGVNLICHILNESEFAKHVN